MSVQGVRGAFSCGRTLDKSHGFSGARRLGPGVPVGSLHYGVSGSGRSLGSSVWLGLGTHGIQDAMISLLGSKHGV